MDSTETELLNSAFLIILYAPVIYIILKASMSNAAVTLKYSNGKLIPRIREFVTNTVHFVSEYFKIEVPRKNLFEIHIIGLVVNHLEIISHDFRLRIANVKASTTVGEIMERIAYMTSIPVHCFVLCSQENKRLYKKCCTLGDYGIFQSSGTVALAVVPAGGATHVSCWPLFQYYRRDEKEKTC